MAEWEWDWQAGDKAQCIIPVNRPLHFADIFVAGRPNIKLGDVLVVAEVLDPVSTWIATGQAQLSLRFKEYPGWWTFAKGFRKLRPATDEEFLREIERIRREHKQQGEQETKTPCFETEEV